MTDERDPIEQWLDAALYGPVGLLLELRERLPELAERGRTHLQAQMSVARMMGQFAVQIGSRKVSEYVQRQRDAAEVDDEPAAAAAPSVEDDPTPPPEPEPTVAPAPSGGALLIEGYDTLAASQVVARLDGLDTDELEVVRVYEAAHRNRKTVLGKVAQLQRTA